MSAPDFSEPCPAVYPGDDAASERIARWMARGAADRGLPRELPVMAALVECGLHNLGGTSFAGFFGMSRALNTGDYRGFRRYPDLQLRWFADTAILVRQRRVAEGRPDPAADAVHLRQLDRRRRAAGQAVPDPLPAPARGGALADRRQVQPAEHGGHDRAAPSSPSSDNTATAEHGGHRPQGPLSGP